MKRTLIIFFLIAGIVLAQQDKEKVLQNENNRLSKLMRAEMQPFISKTVIGNTTIESIEETKQQTIKDKYEAMYKIFETNLLNKPPTSKELFDKALKEELGTPEDQLEMIYLDMLNGTTVWRDKRTEIKNRFR